MAKPWADVELSASFRALNPEQQAAAKQQYFDKVVAPKVPEEKRAAALKQFQAFQTKRPVLDAMAEGGIDAAAAEKPSQLAVPLRAGLLDNIDDRDISVDTAGRRAVDVNGQTFPMDAGYDEQSAAPSMIARAGANAAPAAPDPQQIATTAALGQPTKDESPAPEAPGPVRHAGRAVLRGAAEGIAGQIEGLALSDAMEAQDALGILNRIDGGQTLALGDFDSSEQALLVRQYQEADGATRARIRGDLQTTINGARESTAGRIAQSVRSGAESAFPLNPKYQDSFWLTDIPQGAGSTVPFLAEAAIARGLAGGVGASQLGKSVVSAGAAGYGGAKSAASSQFNDALQNGADFNVALAAAKKAEPIGYLEGLPISDLFRRLDKIGGARFSRAMVEAMKQAGEEGVQEAASALWSNYVAKELYDKDRPLYDDLMRQAGAGGVVGGIMGFLGGLLTGGRHAPNPPRASTPPGAAPQTPPAGGAQAGAKAFDATTDLWSKAGASPDVAALVSKAAQSRAFRQGEQLTPKVAVDAVDDVPDAELQKASRRYGVLRNDGGLTEQQAKQVMKDEVVKHAPAAQVSSDADAEQQLFGDDPQANGEGAEDAQATGVAGVGSAEPGSEPIPGGADSDRVDAAPASGPAGNPDAAAPRAGDGSNLPVRGEESEQTRALSDRAAAYRELAQEKTGNPDYFNADLAKELEPGYSESRESRRAMSDAVQEKAARVRDEAFWQRIAQPAAPGEVVTFMAGGTGSGKSSAIPSSGVVYDTTLANSDSAIEKIERVLKTGREVKVNYVFTEPVTALRRAIVRSQGAAGRAVPVGTHFDTHRGANESARKIAQHFKSDKRVSISIWDNTGEQMNGLPSVPEFDYNDVNEKLIQQLDEERAAGRIDDATYRAFVGAGPVRKVGTQGTGRRGESARRVPEDAGLPEGQSLVEQAPPPSGASSLQAKKAKATKKPLPPAQSASELGDRGRRSVLAMIKKAGGLNMKDLSDITGERGRTAHRVMPGPFRKNGVGIDDVATMLHEAGYLTDADVAEVDGGAEKAREIVQAAIRGEPVVSMNYIDEYNRMRHEENLSGQEAAEAFGIEQAQLDDLLSEGLDPNEAADVLDHDLLAAIAQQDEAAVERAAIQYQDDPEAFMAWALEYVNDRANEGAEAYRSGAEDRSTPEWDDAGDAGEREGDGREAGREGEALALTAQTEESRQAEERAQRDAQAAEDKTIAAEKRKAEADRERNNFTLTGSNRPADVAMAGGQSSMFDARGNAPAAEKAAPAQALATQAEVDAVEATIRQGIESSIDTMKADVVQSVGAKLMKSMGAPIVVGKAKMKQAATNFARINPAAAAEAFGVQLTADMNRVLEARMTAGLLGEQQAASQNFYEKRSAAPKAAAETGNTQDSGEELWYNRRKKTGKGIGWEDVQNLNAALKVKEAVKSKVWPRPDYEQLVADGMNPLIAHVVKQVYDSISTKPDTRGAPTDEQIKLYIETIQRVRDATFSWARDASRTGGWAAKIGEAAKARQQRGAFSIYSMGGDTTDNSIVDAVFPVPEGVDSRNRFRNDKNDNNARALLIGSRKPLGAMRPDFDSAMEATKAISGGWPASKEAWERQGYQVVEKSALKLRVGTFTSQGKEIFTVDGDLNNRSFYERMDSREQAQGFIDELKPFVVFDKRRNIIGQADSREAAAEIAREKVKRGGGSAGVEEEEIPLDRMVRQGEPRRADGEDITSDRLKEVFGFKGVNFGNWMKGDSKAKTAERQAHLNKTYDAFHDLAEVLGIPPKAMSLNGMLGIAFGAQGTGASAGAAHFIPGVNEINLTRFAGAGALAHEWGHAVDHYFAVQGGERFAKSLEPFASALSDRMAGSGTRQEIVAAFQKIANEMTRRPLTEAEAKEQSDGLTNRSRMKVNQWLKRFENQLGGKSPDEFAALSERIRRGDLGEGVVEVRKPRTRYERGAYFQDVIAQLRNLVKDATGKPPSSEELAGLESEAKFLSSLLNKKEGDQNHIPQTATDYQRTARVLDNEKGGKPYWATPWEMFARAFESYAMDKLAEKSARNDYLVRAGKVPPTPEQAKKLAELGASYPYPMGAERQKINAAFDTLVSELKTRTEGDNEVLFRDARGRFAKPASHPYELRTALEEKFGRSGVGNLIDSGIVTIVQSVQDLPDHVRTAVEQALERAGPAALPKALYFSGNSKHPAQAFILADRVTPDEAPGILLHEIGEHFGLKGMLGEKGYAKLLADVRKARDSDESIREAWDQVLGNYAHLGEGSDRFVREVVAHVGERADALKIGWFRELIDKIRTWLWKKGIVRNLTSDDIRRMVVRSLRETMAEAARINGNTGAVDFALLPDTRKAYEQRIDDLFAGAEPNNRAGIRVLDRSDVLDLLGMGNYEVVLAEKHAVSDGRFNHPNFTAEDWKKVPGWLENPVAVFERDDGHLTVIAPETKGGAPIIIAMNPGVKSPSDSKGGIRYHLLLSAYGKDRGRMPIERMLQQGMLRYIDHRKSPAFNQNSGHRLPSSSDETRGLPNRVSTGADLFKYRQTNGDNGQKIDFALQGAAPAAIHTEAFKRWFGDSKVVGDEGEPLVVYHGSSSRFDAFDFSKAKDGGMWFTPDREHADFFNRGSAGRVVDAYLSLKNPMVITQDDLEAAWDREHPDGEQDDRALLPRDFVSEFAAAAKAAGHDGLVIRDFGDLDFTLDVYLAFKPEQIKSATGNKGTFDPGDSRIDFALASNQTPPPGGVSRSAQVRNDALAKAGLSVDGRPLGARISDALAEQWDDIKERVGNQFKEGMFDQFRPIQDAEGNVDPTRSGYLAARMSTSSGTVTNAALLYGSPEWQGNIIGHKADTQGLLSILKPVQGRIDDFLGWMVGKRADWLASEEGGGRENNLTLEEIRSLIDAAGPDAATFEHVARQLRAFNNDLLALARDGGLLSQDQVDAFSKDRWYIPFFRVDPNDADAATGPFTNRGISHQTSGIKRLKGGKLALRDPLQNLLANTHRLIDASMKNRALYRTLLNVPGVARRSSEAVKGKTVRVMWKGKPYHFEISDPALLRALTAVGMEPTRGGVMEAMRASRRLLTTGITAEPTFMIRNFIRDMMHAWIIDKNGFRLALDSAKGAKDSFIALKKSMSDPDNVDPLVRSLMFAGASFMGGHANGGDPAEAAAAMRRALRKRGWEARKIDEYMKSVVKAPAELWAHYREMGDAVENANRLAVARAALAKGKSLEEAVFDSKDLMDFSLRGRWAFIQFLADVVPFFNARLQGLYKLGRASQSGPKLLRTVATTMALRGAAVALASVALAAINDDDDRYDQLEDWDKDANWHIWTGDGEDAVHIRIPKPFELGFIFGTLWERTYRMGTGNEKTSGMMKAWGHFLWDTLAFNPVPQLARPAMEAFFNHDTFRGRPIENMGDEGKLPEDRHNRFTSPAMVAAGDATGMSPKKLQHIFEGYTGTLGAHSLAFADWIVRSARGDVTPERRVSDYPIIGAMVRSGPEWSSQYMTKLYELSNEAEEANKSLRAAYANDADDRAAEIERKHAAALDARSGLAAAKRTISEARKEMDAVYGDAEMSPADKRKALDALQKEINDEAREAVKWAEAAQ